MNRIVANEIHITKNKDGSFKVVASTNETTIQIPKADVNVLVEALTSEDNQILFEFITDD